MFARRSMTKDQEEHLSRVQNEFLVRCKKKYEVGAKEHGGNLWEKGPLWILDQAIDEAIDQFVYLHTLKEQLAARGEALEDNNAVV